MQRTATRSIAAALLFLLALAMAQVGTAETTQININTASADELTTLKGIGEAKSQAIVEYREEHGPFKTVDDLKEVRGIGDKLLEQLRPHVTVGSASPAGLSLKR